MVTGGGLNWIAAWRLRKHISGEWMLALTGRGVGNFRWNFLMWIALLAGALEAGSLGGCLRVAFRRSDGGAGASVYARQRAALMGGSSMLGTPAHYGSGGHRLTAWQHGHRPWCAHGSLPTRGGLKRSPSVTHPRCFHGSDDPDVWHAEAQIIVERTGTGCHRPRHDLDAEVRRRSEDFFVRD